MKLYNSVDPNQKVERMFMAESGVELDEGANRFKITARCGYHTEQDG